jgi:3-hydroxybutyryl-CoA dehydrogenase
MSESGATSAEGYRRPAVAGSGTIGCGLATAASVLGKVRLLARSDASAWRAEEAAEVLAEKVEGAVAGRIKVTTDVADLADCDLVVEAIKEDLEAKVELLARVGEACADADLASTTSSLSIAELADRSGHPDRILGLHVFNPVHKMELVELCLPDRLRRGAAERVTAWCRALEKNPIVVPDETGFVVNRLLFPYLFDAVRLLERTGMDAADVDACMTQGTGHPMGPLALLDLIGLDVAEAIGDALHADSGEPAHRPPGRLVAMVGEGRLGRKSGEGFFEYD